MEYEDDADSFSVDGKRVAVTVNAKIADTDWASHGVDVVCCCTVSLPVVCRWCRRWCGAPLSPIRVMSGGKTDF